MALTTAPYGTADSGDWEKYYRERGGPWVGPVTEGHTNEFGQTWLTTGSWAIESGMGGLDLWVSPGWWQQPPEVDGWRGQCNSLTWDCTFTLRVAPTRLEACGF